MCRVEDFDGNEGWGECTCGEIPSYSEEWTDSCWEVLEKILALMVIDKEFENASDVWSLLGKIRGNRMSKATIETAVWDLEARRLNVPLWKHLGGTQQEIACGVSIGIQDSVEQLLEKIQTEVDAGYRRIKIKIAPHWDFDVIKKVRRTFGDILLMGDANSAYSLDDIELFKKMDEFELMMFEQPLSHSDIFDHAKLQAKIKTPVCLDESIKSPADARQAIEMNACEIINVKLGRVGGHSQAKQIEKICRNANIPVWCGGNARSGNW